MLLGKIDAKRHEGEFSGGGCSVLPASTSAIRTLPGLPEFPLGGQPLVVGQISCGCGNQPVAVSSTYCPSARPSRLITPHARNS